MLPHCCLISDIQWYTENKEWDITINLDEHKSIGTHWIALYMNAENVSF